MPSCKTIRRHGQPEPGPLPEAVRAEDLTSDANRQRGAGLVGRAFAEGLLELEEMEHLLDEVFRSRTVGELAAVTSMLPKAWLAAARRSDEAAQRDVTWRAARSGAVHAYLRVMALLVSIWAVTAVVAGADYFWPIWPALGWGLPLLLGGCGHEDNDGAESTRKRRSVAQ